VTIEAVPGHRNPWWKAIAVTVYEFFSAVDESRPSLVVRNGRGEETKLFNVRTWDEAIERRDQLRDELESTGIQAWGARPHRSLMTVVRNQAPRPSAQTEGRTAVRRLGQARMWPGMQC